MSTAIRRQIQSLWAGEDTFATTLLLMFLDTYGWEGIEWAPPTIIMEIEDDFGVDLPRDSFDRLMAAIRLKTPQTADDFYTSLPDFIQICNVLSGDGAGEQWDPADADECAWGITEAALLNHPPEGDAFSPEILTYVREMVRREGILNPPDVLRLGRDEALHNDVLAKISTAYSDDPEGLESIWKTQDDRSKELHVWLKGRLRGLLEQIQAVPFKTLKLPDDLLAAARLRQ